MFGIGLLAGAALGYWLNTENGKKVRRQVGQTVHEMGQQTASFVQEKGAKVQQTLEDAAEKGTKIVDELVTQAKESITASTEATTEKVEDAGESLNKGIKKASQKIAAQVVKLKKENSTV